MTILYSSRELSGRVEKDAQKHANRFRRRTWWAALWLSVGCLGWLTLQGLKGEYHIFEGGELTNAHKLFANDCAKCHNNWAPLERLVKFDFGGDIHSVTRESCLACHPGSVHHDSQTPVDAAISCAFCHHEHIGDHDLKRLSDNICSTCHNRLEKHFAPLGDNTQPSFASRVWRFGDQDGHPEFAFRRLNANPSQERPSDIGPKHEVLKRLAPEMNDGTTNWRDQAKIKFNHARHLEVLTTADGQPNLAILERLGLDATALNGLDPKHLTDGSQACVLCHKTDAAGRYMQPINFEKNCHQCHKLFIDGGIEAPHESPATVRGFLTEHFTLAVQRSPEKYLIEEPDRAVPGRQQRPRLTQKEADAVAVHVTQVESDQRDEPKTKADAAATHTRLFDLAEATTGRRELGIKSSCVKCHFDEPPKPDASKPTAWEIAKTNIPARWLPHSVFSHQSHQLLNCAECHGLANPADNAARSDLPQPSVFHSMLTGDILLPGVNLCRKCHSPNPEQPPRGAAARNFGARDGCVECHNYHDHKLDSFVGKMNPLLEPSAVKLDAILKGQKH